MRRPEDADALSDAEWADYLFMRNNPLGRHLERWVHVAGCRRWFNVARDTATNEIEGSYRMGEDPPGRAAKQGVRKRAARRKRPRTVASRGAAP